MVTPSAAAQLRSAPIRSFWMAGFEGADHLNGHGEPLDMVRASGHLAQLDADYARVAALGLCTVRESVGWRLSERPLGAGRSAFDFTRLVGCARAARRHGLQVLWSLMHYGTPADVDLFDDAFEERFVRYAAAVATALRPLSDEPPVYTPINEIGFLAWAVAETRLMQPYASRQGGERGGRSEVSGYAVKCRLVRATLAAMQAIRAIDPRARFMQVEPLVHVVAPREAPELAALAEQVCAYQWQTWDLLAGRLQPELGGTPEALDIVGVNHYHSGQWEVGTERRLAWHLHDPRRVPFDALLRRAWQRYRRPLVVAETSHIGRGRAQWLADIATGVERAIAEGVPVHGLCLYPAVDRPDWDNLGHWHHSGLWDVVDDGSDAGAASLTRRLQPGYARMLRRWQQRLPIESGAAPRRTAFHSRHEEEPPCRI